MGEAPPHSKAIAGERNCRRKQLRERETAGAIFLFGLRETRNSAGHAYSERGIARFMRIGIAVSVEERLVVDALGSGLAVIDRGVLAGREMDQREATAAEIACARISHR